MKINYKFKNTNLLAQALTHSSLSSDNHKNYERLEFLGDRVLGVAVASLLYSAFPNEPEGNLSQRFTALVNKDMVSTVALKLELNKSMHVLGEEIRTNENVLCDVCEAIIGAVFIDGGIDAAINFVNENWSSLIHKNVAPPKDAKTTLQEFSHVKNLGMPLYQLVKREGLEHEPHFYISVSLSGIDPIIGEGKNKKLAEFDAAKQMLKRIGFNE